MSVRREEEIKRPTRCRITWSESENFRCCRNEVPDGMAPRSTFTAARCHMVSAPHFHSRLRASTSDESMCKCGGHPKSNWPLENAVDLWRQKCEKKKCREEGGKEGGGRERKKERRDKMNPSLMNGQWQRLFLRSAVKSACLNFLLHQSETKARVCVDKSNYWCFSVLPFMSASHQTKRHRGIVKILFSCLSNNKKLLLYPFTPIIVPPAS